MKEVEEAFAACNDGYAVDRVIADPELNSRFIAQCRARGCRDAISELNLRLFNLRKRGKLERYKALRKTSLQNQDSYRFASEIAARFMERKHGLSLDMILCDPDLATQFDGLAQRIAPGFTPLEYRYAALNLRKVKKLQPELVARVAPAKEILSWSMSEFELTNVPAVPGLYLLFDSTQLLYVGESDNLRSRLKKHLDHSDNKGFARWLWELGPDGLNVEIQVLKAETPARVRKALELELIRSRSPVFNIRR